MVVLIRAHFHFSFLIGVGEGTNGIKMNVTFFTPVGLRRNNSRTLQATVNILLPKKKGEKKVVFIRAHFYFSFLIGGGEGTNGIKLNVTFFTPVGLRRNNSRTLQATVNILDHKELGSKKVVFTREHFHFSFLIGGGEGTNGIKLNVTFFTPVGLRRNNSWTLQANVNFLTHKERGRKNGGFH